VANLALALSRQGAILGDIDHVSLARAADAMPSLERSFEISDEYTHKDATDSLNRGHLQPAVMVLARILRDPDPVRSLSLYDHLVVHLGEIKNNSQFRRYEARALAASTYPLARLGRLDQAHTRLDQALAKLKDLKLYPAREVSLGSELDDALRAQGDLQASVGDVANAVRTYMTLLDLVVASKPAPEEELADAVDLTRLYASLANLHRRAGRAEDASSLDRRRIELWQRWERKLPGNVVVRRELDAVSRLSVHSH
jgi:tetratricopeptide (TPR) repeat protein